MQPLASPPWRRDSNETASDKVGAVHIGINDTLEELLDKALKKLNEVGKRLEKLNSVEHTHRFVNGHSALLNMYFGNCVIYSEGAHKPLVTLELTRDELPLEQVAPPKTDDGQNSEFLDSIAYFAVKRNHLVLLQSMTLRAQDIENHINWLLWTSGVLSKDNRVAFAQGIQKATKTRIQNSTVKSVRIGQELHATPNEATSTKTSTRVKKARYIANRAGDILSQVIGHDWEKKLKLDDSLEGSNLEVAVEVSYKYRTSENGQQLLNDIALSLRDIEPAQVQIDTAEGKIRGDQLWIVEHLGIRCHNGIIDESDLYPKMRKFLVEKLEAGIIAV